MPATLQPNRPVPEVDFGTAGFAELMVRQQNPERPRAIHEEIQDRVQTTRERISPLVIE